MLVWPEHDPSNTLDYSVSYNGWLQPGELISMSTWTLSNGLTQTSASIAVDGLSTTVWLTGGTAGANATIYNTITTNAPRVKKTTIVLPIGPITKSPMTMVLDYVRDARVLLQDQVEPYRYEDDELVEDLNQGLLEIRRLRPDLMMAYYSNGTGSVALPSYSADLPTATVVLDEQYRMALLWYICGYSQLRDEETNQDQRAAAFLDKALRQLTTVTA